MSCVYHLKIAKSLLCRVCLSIAIYHSISNLPNVLHTDPVSADHFLFPNCRLAYQHLFLCSAFIRRHSSCEILSQAHFTTRPYGLSMPYFVRSSINHCQQQHDVQSKNPFHLYADGFVCASSRENSIGSELITDTSLHNPFKEKKRLCRYLTTLWDHSLPHLTVETAVYRAMNNQTGMMATST